MDGSSKPGLIQTEQIFTSWANYYVKFINAYKNSGVGKLIFKFYFDFLLFYKKNFGV